MSLKHLLILLNCLATFIGYTTAQQSAIKIWDYRFGGSVGDDIETMGSTNDHGFILGGYSSSDSSGEKTDSCRGSFDFWIVKMDSTGHKQWDNTFGGTNYDWLTSIQQTIDQGYILGGYSLSQAGGDKSENTKGFMDYWIVKTDSLGNKLWDKDFGGPGTDGDGRAIQISDGGFLVGGISFSGIGGDKSENTYGTQDFWILRLDSLGNKLWDRDLGGDQEDYLKSLLQLTDGGFLLGGYSSSGISGSKSQSSRGAEDYWIIKIDSTGNKIWDKTYGGSESDLLWQIIPLNDGGFLLAGMSFSGVSGEKSQPLWGPAGDSDFWILKIDSLGNLIWDKDFGGSDNEELFEAIQLSDGGFLLSGDSYSPISGNKTENNLGFEQTYAMKIDSAGNIIWDKTIFTNGHDEFGIAVESHDGCIVYANKTAASIGGYKSVDALNGSNDYWVVKLCDSTQMPLPVAGFTAPTQLCPGTCTDFINQSSNALSYQWYFPGASPDSSRVMNPSSICYNTPGAYDVTLVVINPSGSDTITISNYINVLPQPAPQSILQSGDTLFALTGASSYQWYLNGNPISGATEYFYVASGSGDYNVVATDSNGCEVEAAIFDVIASVEWQLALLTKSEGLSIFPNPVHEELKVELAAPGDETILISIFNSLGEKLDLKQFKKSMVFNCRHLSSGLYYLTITTKSGFYSGKFVKQ